MSDEQKQLRSYLENQLWGNALKFLLDHWSNPVSDFDSWLAECFQPLPGRERTCALLHAALNGEPAKTFVDFESIAGELKTISLRAKTIQLAKFADDDAETIRKNLQLLLEEYRRIWNVPVWNELPDRCTTLRPAAWSKLTSSRKNLADLLESIISEFELGWLDPAAAFLADTFLQLAGKSVTSRNEIAECGQTWVLIAADDETHSIPNPSGLLLQLRIEVIPNGCGVFYPHPDHAAHVVTNRQFQMALRNAWQVAVGSLDDATDRRLQDYRWSLTVIDDDDSHRLRKVLMFREFEAECKRIGDLTGRSAEVALAAALKSATDEKPLDLTKAATAQFAAKLPATRNPPLKSVLSLGQKDVGIEAANQLLERGLTLQKIQELVVSTGQRSSVFLNRRLREAADFDAAWRLLRARQDWRSRGMFALVAITLATLFAFHWSSQPRPFITLKVTNQTDSCLLVWSWDESIRKWQYSWIEKERIGDHCYEGCKYYVVDLVDPIDCEDSSLITPDKYPKNPDHPIECLEPRHVRVREIPDDSRVDFGWVKVQGDAMCRLQVAPNSDGKKHLQLIAEPDSAREPIPVD